jgi:NAD(P)-dependent dehydrogenase (short-subunit alcohol dehydrogenase family)
MITGTGRRSALGFNLVLRYLEAGDNVVATIRKESEALSELKEEYGERLHIVNMGTMTFYNATKDDPAINIFCVHPGWIRTDGREDNPAPLSLYDAAETLRLLFEKRRYDKQGHRFITYENEDYPF